jgi:mRNA-degrading endonuclease RelE of RelBE toxin-antitoxin system
MVIKKAYHIVEIKGRVQKFLGKLQPNIQDICLKKIHELEENPIPKKKKYVIDVKNHKMLCELPV